MPAKIKKQDAPLKDNWDSDSSSSTSSRPTSPAPEKGGPTTGFLHLPRETRLEIYRLACLPLRTRHHFLHYDPANRWGRNALTLVHTYPSCGALVATCRVVRWEVYACTYHLLYGTEKVDMLLLLRPVVSVWRAIRRLGQRMETTVPSFSPTHE